MNQVELVELAERVKAATGADRELDQRLCSAFGYQRLDSGTGGPDTWRDPDGHYIGVAPEFTASIDAALSLVERVLPEWQPRFWKHGNGWTADFYRARDDAQWKRSAPTLPLALLAALLSAIAERPE